jgi:hypothetical protein
VRFADVQLRPGAGKEQGSFAWFDFPPSITVDPTMAAEIGVAGELESIFAHELGHHVLAPSTRIDSLKIRHQMARALLASGAPSVSGDHAGYLANMWNDLLVNTRLALLQRRTTDTSSGLSGTAADEPGIVRSLRITTRQGYDSEDRLWWVYRRTYELVWNLVPGALCPPAPPAPAALPALATHVEEPLAKVQEKFREKELALRAARRAAAEAAHALDAVIVSRPELDAGLAAELIRTFLADPVSGALRFGLLAAPYLLEADRAGSQNTGTAGPMMGDACAADDGAPTAGELGRVLADGRLRAPIPGRDGVVDSAEGSASSHGQGFGVAETLALYDGADADTVMAAYYRSEAAPWVRPLTQTRPARPDASIPGPIALWEMGDDLADIDWAASVRSAPDIVAGVTTRRRTWLDDEPVAAEESIELDLYIDSSGSMPDPRRGSPAVLAGTILALSILRGGGRVRVTSFSGPGQVAGVDRFTRDHVSIVGGLTAFIGGGTSFPLDLYGARYSRLPAPGAATRRHVVVLSDDGLRSMFGVGNEPFAATAATVRSKLTTGTLVLLDARQQVSDLAERAGYDVVYLDTMADAPAACARLAEVLHG